MYTTDVYICIYVCVCVFPKRVTVASNKPLDDHIIVNDIFFVTP